jgi:hypothetical protein
MHIDRDALYTMAELTELLGVSLRTLQRHASSGVLPTRRMGANVFVVGSELLDGLPKGKPEVKTRRTRRKAKPEAKPEGDA